MKRYLPYGTQIIASHPMFGPDAIKNNANQLKGLTIVIDTINCKKKLGEEIKSYFRNLGIRVIEMTADQHDRLSAQSQFFSFTINYIAQTMKLKKTQIDTPKATKIFNALSSVTADTYIIKDMIKYNKYCFAFLEKMEQIIDDLKK
jgi:arogenate dehydrogenase (NADP+)